MMAPNTAGSPHSSPPPRPITLLIAALGGEGGGVLTEWIVEALRAAGYPVQATSIPGVAQRTGATTYYIECWPQPLEALNGRLPVLALSPMPGEVDLVVASELLEAGRVIAGGLVTPERTRLITQRERFYTTAEKMAPGDGRYDPETLLKAARARAHALHLHPFQQTAQRAGASLNAVLLGAIAASGVLPASHDTFRHAIRAAERAVEANLRGFEAGLALWDADETPGETPPPAPALAPPLQALLEEFAGRFHEGLADVLRVALPRLAAFQDAAHAREYLELLTPLAAAPPEVLEPTARLLALRMCYEDAIEVARLKLRPERLAALRAGAGAGNVVRITEFLKPGWQEVADIMPVWLARWILHRMARQAESRPERAGQRRGMHLRTDTRGGRARLRLLAGLRRFRRGSWRFSVEMPAIRAWLADVRAALALDAALAREVALSAELIRGYGDTHARGLAARAAMHAALIAPALAGRLPPRRAADALAEARAQALASADGQALRDLLARLNPHHKAGDSP